MIRGLVVFVEIALLVFCLIECIQTPSGSVRNLAKGWWIVLIVLVPIAGPIAWLVAGRSTSAARGRDVPWRSTATAGFPEYERPHQPRVPDDDPSYLPAPDGPDPEKEWLLEQAERQRREREANLPDGEAGTDGTGAAEAPEPERPPGPA